MMNSYIAPWRKLALATLLGFGSTGAFAQALNYNTSGASNVAGTYTDLGTTGTVITTPNNDDANSAATTIGFTFNFNGTAFTDFVLNTNGFIKLGTAAPSAANLYYTPELTIGPDAISSTNPADVNLLIPFNVDLNDGTVSGGAEYRVATSGTAPNRVTTIQWKNVRDKAMSRSPQYDSFSFQVKLYETTNTIEFVYGAAVAGTTGDDAFRVAGVGIKGSGNTAGQTVLVNKTTSAAAWATAVFITGNYTMSAFNYRRATRPDAGRTFRFTSPPPATCPAPTAVTITNPTLTGATVNFTGPANATGYTIIYGPVGFNPASAGTSVAAASSPFTLTGLANSTSYQLYIRTNCGAADQSTLAGPFTFSTTCQAQIVTAFPYAENFDGVATGSLPCGFTVANTNGDTVSWRNRATVPAQGGPLVVAASAPNAMTYYYNEDATTAADDWFFTPALFLSQGTVYKLSFQYRNSGTNYPESLEVKYGTTATPAGQTTTIWSNTAIGTSTFATANETSTPAVLNITPATTGNYYVGFHVFSPADQFFLAVDNLSITATPLGTSPALNRAVSMYPNPSTGMVKLDVRGANTKGNLKVDVVNMLGQTVHTAALKDNFENPLNLSNLANGMYLLKVQTGTDFTTRQLTIAK